MVTTRFELVPDGQQTTFVLRAGDGQELLRGLGGSSKIMVQNEILHARTALRDAAALVTHHGKDGTHWVVLKDKDGSVLAKSPHVATEEMLHDLVAKAQAAAGAPFVDLAKRASHAH